MARSLYAGCPPEWERALATWTHPLGSDAIIRSEYTFPGGVSYTTVVHISEKRAIVYSPGAGLSQSVPGLAGCEVVIVAPSASHTLGVAEWMAAFPQAKLFAAPGCEKELEQSGLAVEDPRSLLAGPPATASFVPGSSLGEVWVSVQLSDRKVVLVCDALINLRRLSPSWIKRTLQYLYGLRIGPGLGPGFRRSLQDPEQFRAWALDALSAADIVLPCHGDLLEGADLEQVRQLLGVPL